MGFHKVFLFLLSLLLAGCLTAPNTNKNIYEQGYRQGVQEQIRKVASEFQGGDFPYYHWTAPIVQEVRVPAHLTNGVMIPEHNELVIIKPGQWAISSGYPIQTQEGHNYDKQIFYMDMDVSNITALPQGMGHTEHDSRREGQAYPTGMEQPAE